jgi:hypothetical protein
MTPNTPRASPAAEYAAMFNFLDDYANHTYPDDVGGLLGQLALLREHQPCDREDERALRKAVSIALTAR